MARTPRPAGAPEPVARNQAIVGFVLGIVAAMLAVVWQFAIPIGAVAMVICWRAAQRARGRDARTIGFAVGGLTVGAAGILLALAALAFGGDTRGSDASTVVDGIESSTPDDDHPPQKDLEPGTRCTVDLAGLRAEGTIANRTDDAWRYGVLIVWENAGVELASSSISLDAVPPGGRAGFTATSPKAGNAETTCRVASIDRLAP